MVAAALRSLNAGLLGWMLVVLHETLGLLPVLLAVVNPSRW